MVKIPSTEDLMKTVIVHTVLAAQFHLTSVANVQMYWTSEEIHMKLFSVCLLLFTTLGTHCMETFFGFGFCVVPNKRNTI